MSAIQVNPKIRPVVVLARRPTIRYGTAALFARLLGAFHFMRLVVVLWQYVFLAGVGSR